MAFDTAVYFDIENLVGGYSPGQQSAGQWSLRRIVTAIRRCEQVGGIAVQKAYADWTDQRLKKLLHQCDELGIEPIQVIGFGQQRKKNAADVQLAIDAARLACFRHDIRTFAIVTGDGGFASLVRSLHEDGKFVIGCGRSDATSSLFRAVCDLFVPIVPKEQAEVVPVSSDETIEEPAPRVSVVSGDPRIKRFAERFDPAPVEGGAAVGERTRAILDWFVADPDSRASLAGEGFHLTALGEAFKHAIPGFRPTDHGFAKFVEFLRCHCDGTQVCVARRPDGSAVLALRGHTPEGWEILPQTEPRETHSAEHYLDVLATGRPMLRLPEAGVIVEVAHWMAERFPSGRTLAGVLEVGEADLAGRVERDHLKQTVLAMLHSGALASDPAEGPIAGRILYLPEELRRPVSLLDAVRECAARKICDRLEVAREDLLERIIPRMPPMPSDILGGEC